MNLSDMFEWRVERLSEHLMGEYDYTQYKVFLAFGSDHAFEASITVLIRDDTLAPGEKNDQLALMLITFQQKYEQNMSDALVKSGKIPDGSSLN